MFDTPDKIMERQNSDRLWLQARPEIDAYLREVAAHAMRPLSSFPPFQGEPERSQEIIEIDNQVAELMTKRNELMPVNPGEVTIRGIRSRRREDGSLPFTIILPGIIGPVIQPDNIPVKIRSFWVSEPVGEDSHQVILGAAFSSGQFGEQKLRLNLNFLQRRDPDERNEDSESNWDDDQENVAFG